MLAVVPFDACAESVLQDFGQDVLEMHRYITGRIFRIEERAVNKWKAYANVAFTSPSMMTSGAAPSVASHRSVTNELTMRIILLGEQFSSTTPI